MILLPTEAQSLKSSSRDPVSNQGGKQRGAWKVNVGLQKQGMHEVKLAMGRCALGAEDDCFSGIPTFTKLKLDIWKTPKLGKSGVLPNYS